MSFKQDYLKKYLKKRKIREIVREYIRKDAQVNVFARPLPHDPDTALELIDDLLYEKMKTRWNAMVSAGISPLHENHIAHLFPQLQSEDSHDVDK
jgi:hypothetical protein